MSNDDPGNSIKKLRDELQITNDILDTILDPIFVKDADFSYTHCNIAFTKYIGLPKEKIINSTVYDVAPKELADIYHEADCKLKERKEVQVYENKVRYADGTMHDVIFHKSPIIRNSEFCGITGIIFDVTEKKKNEQLVFEYLEELKAVNLEKDKFLSIIAHDLKNPFHNILGLTSYLDDSIEEYDMAEIKRIISSIHSTADHAFKLLQNLLLWSNSIRGKAAFVPHTINLLEIINSNFDLLNDIAASKNIEYKSNITKNLEVFGDENMINSVIQNLVTNAIKFTNINGLVEIFAEDGDKFVKIIIKDTGVGISDERKKTLFKLGVNQSSFGTAGECGTGLGLLLCREFIERQGGMIWVESEYGKGSEFIFTLPKP